MKTSKPVNMFPDELRVPCDYCQKNLLENPEAGIIAYLEEKSRFHSSGEPTPPHYHDMYFSCKGDCDRALQAQYENAGFYAGGWNDIHDFTIPTQYLIKLMAFINGIKDNEFEPALIDKMKSFLVSLFPYIAREMTQEEKERSDVLQSLPFC